MQRDRTLTVDQAATREGLTVQAFVQVQMASQSPDLVRSFARLVATRAEIVSAWTLTGEADYLLRVYCPDLAGLNRLIRAGYDLLGLITFFTVGPKETRAWTVEKGSRAPQAAGVIHTDFEKGFIRAETIAYDDYVSGKGEAGARDAGKVRTEGKDDVVQEGDVLHFRFNA